MAIRHNINVNDGSHPTRLPNGRVENIAWVFQRDGVARDATPNVEIAALSDLQPGPFARRNHGSAQNLRDRRHDLYILHWRGDWYPVLTLAVPGEGVAPSRAQSRMPA